jgi:hypothetical protein
MRALGITTLLEVDSIESQLRKLESVKPRQGLRGKVLGISGVEIYPFLEVMKNENLRYFTWKN